MLFSDWNAGVFYFGFKIRFREREGYTLNSCYYQRQLENINSECYDRPYGRVQLCMDDIYIQRQKDHYINPIIGDMKLDDITQWIMNKYYFCQTNRDRWSTGGWTNWSGRMIFLRLYSIPWDIPVSHISWSWMAGIWNLFREIRSCTGKDGRRCVLAYSWRWPEDKCTEIWRDVLYSEERGCGNRVGAETSGFSAGDGSRAFDEAGNGGAVENIGKRIIKT